MAAGNDLWFLIGYIILTIVFNVLIIAFTFIVNKLIIKDLAKSTHKTFVKYVLNTFKQQKKA